MVSMFTYVYLLSVYLWWGVFRFLVQFLIRLFMLLLSFMDSLHILAVLSIVSLANMFSQSVACLLNLLTLSFTEPKFLILMKYSLLVMSFIDYAFVGISKKLLPCPTPCRFLLCCLLGVVYFCILHLGLWLILS